MNPQSSRDSNRQLRNRIQSIMTIRNRSPRSFTPVSIGSPRLTASVWRSPVFAALFAASLPAFAAPPGPTPQVPEGGGPPGPFPNTSVSAVNVIAKGGAAFDSNVEVTALDGSGPIPWSVNRYNRGDFALRLSPGDPTAALANLGQGFIEFGDNSPGVAASQAWRPHPNLGVTIPTARQNGPIDWNDGEGPFFPTVGISGASSGPGYNVNDGSFGPGNLDINTGRAGTHASSPEANFAFSASWFPYDQGWLAGDVGAPADDGTSSWNGADAHATGLTPGMIQWSQFPAESGVYGGLANLVLPGVNALEDGMIFATSSDGGSDVNIVGVLPLEDGSAWTITVREDSETEPENLAAANQSEFQFVYVPFNAQNLVGGHIVGSDGSKRKAVGTFTVTRTAAGTYELTIPGKTGTDGALLLQVADSESGTSVPLASRAFLSYEFRDGKFVIQSRKTTSDITADLVDASFYVAWVDFQTPLSPPDGPRLRSRAPVVVTGEGVISRESSLEANSDSPEVLVVSVDTANVGGFMDPITGEFAATSLVGRFYDPRTLVPTSEPFAVLGSPVGNINRADVKYNPVSKQYVVVATARAYNAGGFDSVLVSLINPVGVGANPVAKAFVHDPDSDQSYDDVAVAVSTANGNFMIVAERKFVEEGEGTVGVLYDKAGTRLSAPFTRLDRLQTVGDEDDPDVVYLPEIDAFLYLTNTDNSNGSTGTLSNRIVGSIVDSSPDSQGALVVRTEQPMADGEPAGTAEGHPASILNPFNNQIITAFDGGNGTAIGDLSYRSVGPAPDYSFAEAQPEVPYLRGGGPASFNHQHPQLAVDTEHGVIVLGFNAVGSSASIPDAYAFRVLGPNGQPLPSQLGTPYYLAESPGGLGNSVNFHNVKYSAATASFVVAYTSTPGITYLAALEVTSSHLAPSTPPSLTTARSGASVVLSWPASATGYQLQSTPSLAPAAWQNSSLTPVVEGDSNKVTVSPSSPAQFYRLAKP
ncbi:MAG: hypothetical protein AB7J34_01380 [Limisphaerales bacterium]